MDSMNSVARLVWRASGCAGRSSSGFLDSGQQTAADACFAPGRSALLEPPTGGTTRCGGRGRHFWWLSTAN